MQRPNARVATYRRPAAVVANQVAVAAIGLVAADHTELARLRAETQPPAAENRVLRHSDEQTVLAVAAVLEAASSVRLGPFDDWSVIVAPRWFGRSGTANVIERFHTLGYRGVGPQSIPNLSMHAAAATVSLCLAARGQMFGAGGGPAHVADGLFAALAAQIGRGTPGTWLALTEWEGDEVAGSGRAVAMALAPIHFRPAGLGAPWTLSRHPGPARAACKPVGLVGLADFLARATAARWDCPLDGGGELSLTAEGEP